MSLFDVFDIAGSAMMAQSVRLNTTASNLANAETVAGSAAEAYRARHPVFALSSGMRPEVSGVRVTGIVESTVGVNRVHQPGHALADEDGYVFRPNVNPVEELVNMISAQRSYQGSVEVLNTSRELMMRTLSIGQ